MFCGDSSDGEGLVKGIKYLNKDIILFTKNIVIFGAGGASKSIIYELLLQGNLTITLVNRTLYKAVRLKEEMGDYSKFITIRAFDELEVDNYDIAINTTSVGNDGVSEISPNLNYMKRDGLIVDIIYSPVETPLLLQAKQENIKAMNGELMLIFQAVIAFELWYGIKPEVNDNVIEVVFGKKALSKNLSKALDKNLSKALNIIDKKVAKT